MKSTAEILELLRIYNTQFASKYGFKRLGVFGSVARGEQTEQSDVDVCYEGEPPSLLTLEHIQSELEELLGSPVDLIRIRERMNARLKQRILKESIYV
ncbi:nucleotidyltransferase family protein [Bacteroides clarus]|jgi:predicted nucleotidyltransferase|uniref:nucleotidyltransferase family protein n=1 Tax=Bacteroides clarus TaxID=626929 RepID=UPI0026744FD2|nr:nucleotidyltransferase family protein [Bacteroides clarus]